MKYGSSFSSIESLIEHLPTIENNIQFQRRFIVASKVRSNTQVLHRPQNYDSGPPIYLWPVTKFIWSGKISKKRGFNGTLEKS